MIYCVLRLVEKTILQKKKRVQNGRVKVSTHDGTSPCNKLREQVLPVNQPICQKSSREDKKTLRGS